MSLPLAVGTVIASIPSDSAGFVKKLTVSEVVQYYYVNTFTTTHDPSSLVD